jgi:hypothetical protein
MAGGEHIDKVEYVVGKICIADKESTGFRSSLWRHHLSAVAVSWAERLACHCKIYGKVVKQASKESSGTEP